MRGCYPPTGALNRGRAGSDSTARAPSGRCRENGRTRGPQTTSCPPVPFSISPAGPNRDVHDICRIKNLANCGLFRCSARSARARRHTVCTGVGACIPGRDGCLPQGARAPAPNFFKRWAPSSRSARVEGDQDRADVGGRLELIPAAVLLTRPHAPPLGARGPRSDGEAAFGRSPSDTVFVTAALVYGLAVVAQRPEISIPASASTRATNVRFAVV